MSDAAGAVLDEEALQRLLQRGAALHRDGRHEEARAIYRQGLAADPGRLKAWLWLGLSWLQTKEPEEARACFERAIAIDPACAAAHNELGTALNDLVRPEEALARFDAAIALDPVLVPAHVNRGFTLHELGRLDEALESCDRALALAPDHVEAHLNRSLSLLRAGRFEEGWRAFEWRKRKWEPDSHAFQTAAVAGRQRPRGAHPVRLRRAGPGRHSAVRPLPQAAAGQWGRSGGVRPGRGHPPVALARAWAAVPRPGRAPAAVRPPLRDAEPAARPVGRASGDPGRDAVPLDRPGTPGAARRLLGPRVRPRIGIAGSGNPSHAQDRFRSIPFKRFSGMFCDGADWFALQNAINPRDVDAFLADGRVRAFGAELGDFADTAALVDHMDLVVTVDTSLAHLAGALGKPVWILLAANPDWRWMLDRPDTPWYPTARLFRQPPGAGWSGVIDEIRAELGAGHHVASSARAR